MQTDTSPSVVSRIHRLTTHTLGTGHQMSSTCRMRRREGETLRAWQLGFYKEQAQFERDDNQKLKQIDVDAITQQIRIDSDAKTKQKQIDADATTKQKQIDAETQIEKQKIDAEIERQKINAEIEKQKIEIEKQKIAAVLKLAQSLSMPRAKRRRIAKTNTDNNTEASVTVA